VVADQQQEKIKMVGSQEELRYPSVYFEPKTGGEGLPGFISKNKQTNKPEWICSYGVYFEPRQEAK